MLTSILIAAGLGVGLTQCLRGQTSQQQKAPDNSSVNIAGSLLMPTYSDLKAAAAISNLIVKGEVLPGTEIPIDLGGRRPFFHSINPVKMISIK